MAAVVLTAKSVAALAPRTDRYIVRDAKVSGLELRVSPDGTKAWSLRYRVLGQQRRLKLGVYDRMSLAKARAASTKELRKVDAGTDPQAERQAAKRAAEQAKRDSIDALCEQYIERHAKVKKRTWRDDQSMIRNEIVRVWKGRPVTAITRRDCRELVQRIATRTSKKAPTGATIFANRIAALLSRLFRFAVDEEIIPANPAAHLPKPGVEAQARPDGARPVKPYSGDEIRTIWLATHTLDAPPRAIYRLGLITGQRPAEISNLEWAEIQGDWWTIPASRTKNGREHRVFLSALAHDALRNVPRIVDEPRAFAGWRGKRQLAAVNTQVFAAVTRRPKPRHAMRDTVATGLAECGVAIEDISKVLNHVHGSRITAIYNAYAYDKEKRLAMTKWERRLTAILGEKHEKTPGNVRAFTRGA